MRKSWVWGLLLGAAVGIGGTGCKSSKMSGSGGGTPAAAPAPAPKKPDATPAPAVTKQVVSTPDAPTRPADWCRLRFFAGLVRKGETCDAFAARIKNVGLLLAIGITTYTTDDYQQLKEFPADPVNPVRVIVYGSTLPPDGFTPPTGMTMETTVPTNLQSVYDLFLKLLTPSASEVHVKIKGNTDDELTKNFEFAAPKAADGDGLIVNGDEVVVTIRTYDLLTAQTAGATGGILGGDSGFWICKIGSDGSSQKGVVTVRPGGFKALVQTAGALQALTGQESGGFVSVNAKLDKLDEAQNTLRGTPDSIIDAKIAGPMCALVSSVYNTTRLKSGL